MNLMKKVVFAVVALLAVVSANASVETLVVTNQHTYWGNSGTLDIEYRYRTLKEIETSSYENAEGAITNGTTVYHYAYKVGWQTIAKVTIDPENYWGSASVDVIGIKFLGILRNKATMAITSLLEDEEGRPIFSGDINIPDILSGEDRECTLGWYRYEGDGTDWGFDGYDWNGYEDMQMFGEHSFDDVTSFTFPKGYSIPQMRVMDSSDICDYILYCGHDEMGLWNLREITLLSRPYMLARPEFDLRPYLVFADQVNVSEEYEGKWRKVLTNLGYGGRFHVIGSGVTNYLCRAASATPASTVSLSTTNVVVHYVMSNVPTSTVTPIEGSIGFVNVVTEVEGGAVAVPSTWAENYPTFTQLYGADFTAALMKKSGKKDSRGNDMFVWQDYVAGTDPTKKDEVFRASITMVNGVPTISYTPELNEVEKAKRVYTIYGKVKLADSEWSVVNGDISNYNFFKVVVGMKR